MNIIILILIYLLSIIGVRYSLRICHKNKINVKPYTFSYVWIIPIFNTIICISMYIGLLILMLSKSILIKKFLNLDLEDVENDEK